MKSLVLSVLFVSVLGLCECCKCAVRPPLDLGCASDFIIKTKVQSKLLKPVDPNDVNGFYYTISKPYTYKFNFPSYVKSAVNKARVYTSESTASCGVYLEKGKTYILSGSVNKEKKRMEINSCSSWVETTPISTESEQLLKKFKQGTVQCP